MEKIKKRVVIIGGGMSGLAAADFLLDSGHDVTVIEKNQELGGMCRSFRHKDFIIDLGPHKIYSQLPGMMAYFRELLGEDNLVIKKRNSLALLGKYFIFPPQIGQMIRNISPKTVWNGTLIGFSFAAAKVKGIFSNKKHTTYEGYLSDGFGKKGYEVIFRDYAWKVWGDPKKLSAEIAKKRMPVPNIIELIKNILIGTKNKPDVSAEYFYYPKLGMQQMVDKLAQRVKDKGGKIITGADPIELNIEDSKISLLFRFEGKIANIDAEKIISSIPLKGLIKLLGKDVPADVKNSADSLKSRSLILAYFILDTKHAMKDNWIFFPEKRFMFNRVSEQKSFSRYTCPKDKTLITAEVTTDIGSEIYRKPDNEIIRMVKDDLLKAEILKESMISEQILLKIDDVYPVYSIDYRKHLEKVLDYLDTLPDLISIGRPGMFNYNNMDHTIDMSRKAAEHIDSNKSAKDWKNLRSYFDSYRIVD